MSEWHNIGRISPVPAGTWSSAKAYKRLDIVTDSKGEKSYIALKDVPAGTALSSNTAYWQLIADVSEAVANANSLAVNAVNRLTSPFTKNGDIVVCNPVEQHPLNAKSIVEPVQAGSGDPSPDNVRPITGYAGAKLTKCGKNLLKLDETVNQTKGGITFTANPDGTITLSGKATSDVYKIIVDRLNVPDGDYILTGCPSGAVDLNYILYVAPSTSSNRLDTGNGVSFSVDNRQTYNVTIRVLKGTDVTGLVFKPMVRLATETDATYEPYQGETFSANFGQTVYGGTLNWITGVLTVDRAEVSLADNENIQHGINAAGWFTYYGLASKIESFSDDKKIADIVCSHYKSATASDLYNTHDAHFIAQNNGTEIWFSDTNFSSKDDFKAYLAAQYAAGTPVQIVYKLATPTVIQLTPAQITALQGMNNIWCDAGETTVSGRKDILWLTDYLIDRIKALETAIISTGGNV